VFEEVEGAFGALPGWFCVAVAAFEVDPEDADQPGGGDERPGVGGCAGLVGQRRGLLEAGEDFPLVGAQRGAVADQRRNRGVGSAGGAVGTGTLTGGPGWLWQ
jgi:hypothetical protein